MSEIRTVARPYAKAIFESALERNSIQTWARALKNLAIISSDKKMQSVLTNPLLSKQQLANLVTELANNSLDEENKRLVVLLAYRKRLNLLPAIAQLFEEYVAQRERTIEVKVVSAYPIDDFRLQRMQHALQDKLKRKVTLQCLVDPALIGGAVIYAGNQVIDGSLSSKLKRLSERLCS
jgi:F-type H+-transporting ATPase subunit delta